MLLELLEAVEFGKEVGGIAQGLINGDHYDAVDKAISMCDAIDYNAPTWREEINEILDTISCVNKNDRAFVRAAATCIRACCYFDLGDYAKARQSISECSMISVDSWTINKDVILDCQKRAKELRKEIDKQTKPHPQISAPSPTQSYPQNSNDRKRQQKQQNPPKQKKPQQIQNPCTNKQYSRAELLRIVAECDANDPNRSSESTVISYDVERLRNNLQRRGINISKTQIGKVSTYKGLVDYIESHTVVENSHNSSSKPTQSNHQTQNQVSKNNDMASNKTNEPVYFSVGKVENIYVVGGSGVQCMTTTSRQGRVNYYFANYTKMVVVNPSGKTVSAVVQSLEHSQYGSYFLPVDPNNSLKKDEFVRVILKDISASEIEVGSKIYIEEDYNKIPKSDSLESSVDYFSLPFSMPVEDVFSIDGRGTIITGKIATGRVHVDDVIYLVKDGTVLSATVKGCEMFRKLLDQAEYGDNVGLLLQGVSPDQVKKGMMATAIKPEASEVSSVLPSTSNDDKDMAKPKDNTPVQKPNQSCPSTEEQEYLEELKECLADGEIGPRERRLLDKLASKLGISPERASELEASLSASALTDDEKEYYEEVHAVLSDGEISDKERRLLEKLRKMLNISEERAKEIEAFAAKK